MGKLDFRPIAIAILSVMAFSAAAGGKVSRCVPGPGATGSPKNIEQLVDLINSLPKPVTIPCVIESLDRPLGFFATNSTTSLQLSTSADDPRFFIINLPLLISITSDGPGADLLEASVLHPGNKLSLKSEIHFPVSKNISYARPYERIRLGAGTNCGICHGGEARDPAITSTEAFASRAIQPFVDSEVTLARLRELQSECQPDANRKRCELLDAILEHGPVRRQEFPADMPRGL
jgi:hypothetical protein